MWVVERDFPRGANIAEVNASGEVKRYPVAGFWRRVSADYGGLAAGPDNTLWWAATELSRLARIDVTG